MLGGVDDSAMNLVASLADFVYEIAFCLAIWAAAKNCAHDWASPWVWLAGSASLSVLALCNPLGHVKVLGKASMRVKKCPVRNGHFRC